MIGFKARQAFPVVKDNEKTAECFKKAVALTDELRACLGAPFPKYGRMSFTK